jgi:hypothetical protein
LSYPALVWQPVPQLATAEMSPTAFSKGGLPTQMKMASATMTALSDVSDRKSPELQLRDTMSSRYGSKALWDKAQRVRLTASSIAPQNMSGQKWSVEFLSAK